MDGVVTLIAAYAEEDRRLRDLVAGFPVALRDVCGRLHHQSLKQTIGHLAFWDDFAVEFYHAYCRAEHPESLTFSDFEAKNHFLLKELCAQDWETVLASYRRATCELCLFLTGHWDELETVARENFKIPLKHRRHHRRRLFELAAELGLAVGGPAAAEQVN